MFLFSSDSKAESYYPFLSRGENRREDTFYKSLKFLHLKNLKRTCSICIFYKVNKPTVLFVSNRSFELNWILYDFKNSCNPINRHTKFFCYFFWKRLTPKFL